VSGSTEVHRIETLIVSIGESMVPEGLEWASAEGILDDIKSVGFNFIRM
jgi:hypothetical protein